MSPIRTELKERRPHLPVPMAARRRFGRYKREEGRITRRLSVERDEVLEILVQAFRDMPVQNNYYDKFTALFIERIKSLSYSQDQIQRFVLALMEFQDRELFESLAGTAISALVNNGPDSNYSIDLRHFDTPIKGLGFKNCKHLIFYGDVGILLGKEMTSGTITVHGNADSGVGETMSGGLIVVNGDADDYVGREMTGGEIRISGNARDFIGKEMSGGKILIAGDAGEGVGKWMSGGEIHVKGDFKDCGRVIRGKVSRQGIMIKDK
jgi:hypothetical protein